MNANDLKGKHVLVVGMARSGISAAKLLLKLEASVVCHDAKPLETLKDEAAEFLLKNNLKLIDDAQALESIASFDILVLSPGVPETLPFIKKAYELGLVVIPEIELGFICARAEFVAISGTNGKTTTTALTGEIFKNSGRNTYVLGNIGLPVCEFALKTKKSDIVVMEAAAFQLNPTVEFHPKAAAVLNLTEDHLERFITMEAYQSAKENIFKNQTKADFAILNFDNEITKSMANKTKAKVFYFSIKEEVEQGSFLRNKDVIFKMNGTERYICNTAQINLPGSHNLENALAACTLASCQGVSAQVIRHTFMTFKGVEHRIEFVRELDGIRFYNDSKATNPDATMRAIEAMKNPTVLILGGSDKQNDFSNLFYSMDIKIKSIVVLGATKQKILSAAEKSGYKNIYEEDTFIEAVTKAKELASDGYNVLLSPACASYDMFSDFEQRGRVFKEIVNSF